MFKKLFSDHINKTSRNLICLKRKRRRNTVRSKRQVSSVKMILSVCLIKHNNTTLWRGEILVTRLLLTSEVSGTESESP